MSIPYHKTKAFKKLNAKWQKKLEKSGFEDIEKDETSLKIYHREYFYRSTHIDQGGGSAAKSEYFYLATKLLNDYVFKTEVEKSIWGYHADGLPVREILLKLSRNKPKITRSKVENIITKLRKLMKSSYLGINE